VITAASWFAAIVRLRTAERLVSRSRRIISTGPSPPLGIAVARPDCTARAAASASMLSDLP
jgi:hypothetical protein